MSVHVADARTEQVEARIWEALRHVDDPEIPVSVVGHGPDRVGRLRPQQRSADLQITFTAMGCPAMEFIEDDIREALLARPGDRRRRDRGGVGSGLDQGPDPRRRARGDAAAGDPGMSRGDETVWEVFARQAYEEPLHHVGTVTEVGRGPGARLGARDLRRAAVDPHDPRAAQRNPGGNPRMSTPLPPSTRRRPR